MICVPKLAKTRAALASRHNKTHKAEVLLSKLKKGSVLTGQHNAHMTISGTWIKCILWWTTKNALYDILLSFCTRPETITVSMCFILMLQRNRKTGVMFYDEMLRKAFWWEHVALFISSTKLSLDRMGFTSLNCAF